MICNHFHSLKYHHSFRTVLCFLFSFSWRFPNFSLTITSGKQHCAALSSRRISCRRTDQVVTSKHRSQGRVSSQDGESQTRTRTGGRQSHITLSHKERCPARIQQAHQHQLMSTPPHVAALVQHFPHYALRHLDHSGHIKSKVVQLHRGQPHDRLRLRNGSRSWTTRPGNCRGNSTTQVVRDTRETGYRFCCDEHLDSCGTLGVRRYRLEKGR